jgi:hypothetical protein
MTNTQPLRMGVRQAASMLGLSEPAVRQLLKRRPELLPVENQEGRMTLDVNDVEQYFARKRQLPYLNDAAFQHGIYIDIFRAGAILLLPTNKVLSLIKSGDIQGGVTMDNQLMLLLSSVKRYATGEANTNESADL